MMRALAWTRVDAARPEAAAIEPCGDSGVVDVARRFDAGVPFGCIVQPLADDVTPSADAAEDVGRCVTCGAYMNVFCSLLKRDWRGKVGLDRGGRGRRWLRQLHRGETLLRRLDTWHLCT